MRYLLLDLLQRIYLPGCLTQQHFVQHHSYRPDISLLGVDRVAEDLRGHVQGTAHDRCEYLLVHLQALGEAQVANFESVIVDQHVGWLHVPVDDLLLMQVPETFEDVLSSPQAYLKQAHGLGLRQFALPVQIVLQAAPVAVFAHQVYVILGTA